MDKGDGSIKYILTGEGAGTTFTIDDSTGDIHAIQRLDREVKAQYVLRAQARNRLTDRPLEPESEFIVKIQDINDNEPKFLDGPYQAFVLEMSRIGKIKKKVKHMGRLERFYCAFMLIFYNDKLHTGNHLHICQTLPMKITFKVNLLFNFFFPNMENTQSHPFGTAAFSPLPLCSLRNVGDPGDCDRCRRPHIWQQRSCGLQHPGGSAILLCGCQNRYSCTQMLQNSFSL